MGNPPTVLQCLKQAGLEQFWPSLQAAGFSSMEGLAELHQDYFSALGVHDANDRRKLFLLVQTVGRRLGTSVSEQQENQETTTNASSSSNDNDGFFVSRIPVPPSRTSGNKRQGTAKNNNFGGSRSASEDEDNQQLYNSQQKQDDEEERMSNELMDEEENDEPMIIVKDGDNDATETQRSSSTTTVRQQKIKVGTDPKSLAHSTRSATTATTSSSRPPSKLSVPKKRSTVPAATINAKTQPSLNTRSKHIRYNDNTKEDLFPPSQNNAPAQLKPSQDTATTASSMVVDKNASFKTRIEALWRRNAENHAKGDVEISGNEEKKMLQSTANHDPGSMRIRVVVRKRPMSTTELALAGNVDILQVLDCRRYGKILVYQPKTLVDLSRAVETIPYAFDNAFDADTNNAEIYERAIRPLIPGLFAGQWATLFAYGQTGSGKTFTMFGSVHHSARSSAHNYGLYFLAAMDIFQELKKRPDLEIGVSLFEIYGGKLFDLFNNRQPVKCLEDYKGQIHFPGLMERNLCSPHDLMHWIHESSSLRSTGTTSRNAGSSRSHAVLQLHIRKKSDKTEYSRLSVIDLAGSERGSDVSTACQTTRKEGAEINTSLLSLKEVIRALAKGDSVTHVPFRGSKLTQVLKESFVGANCRCVMIACVAPNIGNCEQTLNTLRYSNRVKERNPETGETSAEAGVPNPGESSDSLTQSETSESESRVLDKLLASNASLSQFEVPVSTEMRMLPETLPANSLVSAKEVIESHKRGMRKMLEMTNAEMDLSLNPVVSVEEYLRDVAVLQTTQIELCQDLRDRIKEYRLSCSSSVGPVSEFGEVVEEEDDDDDSIEDLR